MQRRRTDGRRPYRTTSTTAKPSGFMYAHRRAKLRRAVDAQVDTEQLRVMAIFTCPVTPPRPSVAFMYALRWSIQQAEARRLPSRLLPLRWQKVCERNPRRDEPARPRVAVAFHWIVTIVVAVVRLIDILMG